MIEVLATIRNPVDRSCCEWFACELEVIKVLISELPLNGVPLLLPAVQFERAKAVDIEMRALTVHEV